MTGVGEYCLVVHIESGFRLRLGFVDKSIATMTILITPRTLRQRKKTRVNKGSNSQFRSIYLMNIVDTLHYLLKP